MLHIDEADLALLALGEPSTDDERAHLRVCVRCQREFDRHSAIVAVGRHVTVDDVPVEPGDHVWSRIAAELGLEDTGVAAATPAAESPGAEVVELAQVRRGARRRTAWVGAAAAAAGIAIGAIGATTVSPNGTVPLEGQVVAQTQLTVVPADAGGSDLAAPGMSGLAVIVDTDGRDFAEVDARGLPAAPGFYEVWLIKPDLSGMLSLGALSAGSQGRFTIPPGTDLAQYTIVDVSLEPFDGDPAHSKKSMLRGTLEV
jgi:hypothetical protein